MKTKLSISLTLACLLAAPAAFGASAADLYAKNCASCHGANGNGQTAMGKKNKVGDYTKEQSFSDAEAKAAILNGKGKMKGYKDKISDAEATELVKYIRSFKK
jgi:cytochrome c6